MANGGALADFDFRKRIRTSALTKTRTITQSKIQPNCNPRARMHEGCTLHFRLKHAQPKKSPRIERLWGPLTKKEPAEFPESAQSALAVAPRGFERTGLIRINSLFVGHLE